MILEEEEGRERKTLMWEGNIDRLPLALTLARDWTRNLGMCPEQEWNPQPFLVYSRCSNQLRHPAKSFFLDILNLIGRTCLFSNSIYHLLDAFPSYGLSVFNNNRDHRIGVNNLYVLSWDGLGIARPQWRLQFYTTSKNHALVS